jgi:hypothetical protein
MPAVRWHVHRTQLPLVHRRCSGCPGTELGATGRFRVNANANLIDVWLLLRCRRCGAVTKVPILERVPVRSIPPDRLDGFTRNDAALICWALREGAADRRRRMRLDWTGAWELTGPPTTGPVTVEVKFRDPVPLRPAQIIAAGLGVSHGEVRRRLQAQTLALSVAPGTRRVEGFSFRLA